MLDHLLFETRLGDWLLALVERLGLAIVRKEDLER